MGLSSLKVPLRWVIKLVVVHPLSSIAVVVLLGVALLFVSGRVPPPLLAQARGGSTPSAVMPQGNIPAPASTESFMKGQASFNADLVWDALSNDLHDNLTAQGSDKQAIQDQLDQYKKEGRQIDSFTYVGGYAPGGSKAFYFYVASIRRPELNGQADQVFFAFTVDPSGKIIRVE